MPSPTAQEVVPNLRIIQGSFLGVQKLDIPLLLGDRFVLVDSGSSVTPEEEILPYLETVGLAPEDLALVVHTHAHLDHFGGDAALRRHNPDIRFAMSRTDMGWAENHLKHWNQMYLAYAGEWDPSEEYKAEVLSYCGPNCCIDEVLAENGRVEVGKGLDLEVVPAPAHSPGHVMFLVREHGVLIAGDAIQGHGVPVSGGEDVFPFYLDVNTYRASLDRITQIAPETLCTAHFGVMRGNEISAIIQDSLAFVDEFHERALDELKSAGEPLSLAQLADRLHDHYSSYEKLFQIHATTYTHAQEMVATGEAYGVVIDDVKHWVAP